MNRFASVVDRLSHGALIASTVLVAYLMVTQALEVVLRTLGRPTTWVYDLNLVAIIGVVFLGLAGAEQARENVAVEFLSERFTGRPKRVLQLINASFALILLALLAWFGAFVAFESFDQGRTTGGLFPIPAALPEASLPLGAVLLALQIIVDLFRTDRPDIGGGEADAEADLLEAETAAGDIPRVILLVLLGSLGMLLIGTAVYVFLGLPAALGMLSIGVPGEAIAARVYEALRSDTLITVPMFLLVGNVLISSRAMKDLVDCFDSLVGHVRGGMVLVVVTVAVFFGGISGATTAEASIMALALATPMAESGYPRKFTAGLLAATSTVAILIPPSVPMILYSSITGASISKLFLAGLVPGLLVSACLAGAGLFIARRNNYGGSRPAASWTERRQKFLAAVPVMTIPIFIVVAIYTGFSTASEVGAVAAVASILVTQFAYRDLGRQKLAKALVATARTSAAVLIMNGTAQLLAWLLTYEQVPQGVTEIVAAAHLEPWMFLIAVNILFLILGLPLDPPPIMFMTLPIIFPTLALFGIDPIHFAVLMMVNMTIAQISPPAGSALFAMATVAKIPLQDVFRGVAPFIVIMLIALVVITYVPAISLFLVQ